MQTTYRLQPSCTAPARARRHTRQQLAAWHQDTDTAELLVSELVTNAWEATADQARTIDLRLSRGFYSDDTLLFIEVWDSSDEANLYKNGQKPAEPIHDCENLYSENGRGLMLIEALSVAWNTYPYNHGKVVWCAVEC